MNTWQRGVLLAIMAVIGASAVIWNRNRPGPTPEERDFVLLKKKDATEDELFGAFIRLGERKYPAVRAEALSRVGDRSKRVRGGAADALGHYDDAEALRALEELIADPEDDVRIKAIQAFSYGASEAREERLQALLARSRSWPVLEKATLYTSLYYAGARVKTKDEALGKLIELARTPDPAFTSLAVSRLIPLAPRHPLVIAFLRESVEKPANPALLATAVRHLALVDEAWLRPRLPALRASADPAVRAAAQAGPSPAPER